MTSLDYSLVADIYDGYCLYDEDVSFWVSVTRETRGPILELMAGTGRVSLPLMENGRQVVCTDRDVSMLSVLRRKARSKDMRVHLVCSDVGDLAFSDSFELIILPFQGFSELVHEGEQRRALCAVVGSMAKGGTFVCTLHNPQARLRTIDGSWHEVVNTAHPNGCGSLAVSIKADFDPVTCVVRGIQRIDEYDETGEVARSRSLSLSFSLLEEERFAELADEAGLEVVSLFGDYEGAPFDRNKSPVMVWRMRRKRN